MLTKEQSGYENHKITLIKGTPGSGKTKQALILACEAAVSGKKVLFLSGEQAVQDILKRLVSFIGWSPLILTTLRIKYDKYLSRGLILSQHYDLIVVDGYCLQEFLVFYSSVDQWSKEFIELFGSDIIFTINVSREPINTQYLDEAIIKYKIKDINQMLSDAGIKDINNEQFVINITKDSCSIKTNNIIYITNTHILLDK